MRANVIALTCWLAAAAAAQGQEPAQSVAVQAQTQRSAYVLGPGDVVRVNVFGETDLSGEQTLGPNGEISAPLIGDVPAAGMTTAQLAQALETRYRDGFLRSPQISVTVATYRPFYVIGEVVRPGPYPFAADLTPTSAIAFAGGFTRRADRGRVYVKRAGEAEERAYELDAELHLQPGDTVRVGEGFLSALREIPFGLIR